MGELYKKTFTVIAPEKGGETYTFATSWQCDSWNCIHTILYPDGELIEYDYDNGGKLISIIGNKAITQNYINNIKDDESDSRTYFEYGNRISFSYIYNTATPEL